MMCSFCLQCLFRAAQIRTEVRWVKEANAAKNPKPLHKLVVCVDQGGAESSVLLEMLLLLKGSEIPWRILKEVYSRHFLARTTLHKWKSH